MYKNLVTGSRIILLAVLCVILFTSCQSGDMELSTEDGTLANNDILDFYFYYPSDFILDKSAVMISVYVSSDEVVQSEIEASGEPYSFLVHPNLSATALGLPSGTYNSIDSFWEAACMPVMQETFTEMEITDTQDLEIDGSIAKRYDYTATLSGMPFKYSQVLIFKRGSVYTLTYTSSPKNFDKYINVLDTAIRTFTFK